MILLELADFKGGKYDIPDADGVYTDADVQEAIDNFEKQYIYQLLGVTTGDLVIAYIQAVSPPANADYDVIIDSFSMDNAGYGQNPIVQSLGLKEYLKAAVFYEYNKTSLLTSQAGVTDPQSETATKQSSASVMRFSENKFNDILDTIEAIQWYCMANSTAFPDFNGQRIVVKFANIL